MRRFFIKSKSYAWVLVAAFFLNAVTSAAMPWAQAQGLDLPSPGQMVSLSPSFNLPVLAGVRLHPDNAFQFDFIVNTGDSLLSRQEIADEGRKLISYFLASITTPEEDIWVNLSPYENQRIVPFSFGQTEMGQALLGQDYMLKQIMATALYPERQLGKAFWNKVYSEALKKFHTTQVPISTYNKVWIVPDKAVVHENAQMNAVFVIQSSLKVMLEQDYLAMKKHDSQSDIRQPGDMFPVNRGTCPEHLRVSDMRTQAGCQPINPLNLPAPQVNPSSANEAVSAIGSQIIREIVIPALEKEVNEGANFAPLRQVYQSMILAKWYKENLRRNVISEAYANRNKTDGVDGEDKDMAQKIYDRYLTAYKKGVYSYIKEEMDPITQSVIPRKYFSGGVQFNALAMTAADGAQLASFEGSLAAKIGRYVLITAGAVMLMGGAAQAHSAYSQQAVLDMKMKAAIHAGISRADAVNLIHEGRIYLAKDPHHKFHVVFATHSLKTAGHVLHSARIAPKLVAGEPVSEASGQQVIVVNHGGRGGVTTQIITTAATVTAQGSLPVPVEAPVVANGGGLNIDGAGNVANMQIGSPVKVIKAAVAYQLEKSGPAASIDKHYIKQVTDEIRHHYSVEGKRVVFDHEAMRLLYQLAQAPVAAGAGPPGGGPPPNIFAALFGWGSQAQGYANPEASKVKGAAVDAISTAVQRGSGLYAALPANIYMGNAITVQGTYKDGKPIQVTYGHINQSLVASGASVSEGQGIALSGNTGLWTTGAHVLIVVKRMGSDGEWHKVDPGPYVGYGPTSINGHAIRNNEAKTTLAFNVPAPMTSGEGYRIHPITGSIEDHPGGDWAVPEGTRLKSIVNGTVTVYLLDSTGGVPTRYAAHHPKWHPYKLAYHVKAPHKDAAMAVNGGIDLNGIALQDKDQGGVQTAFSDPQQRELLLNADGLLAVVYDVKPMTLPLMGLLLGSNR